MFRNDKDNIEIQSTYYPIMMIGKIFYNNIVRIEKERKDKVFSYKCYDENEVERLEYHVDWKENKLILFDKYAEIEKGIVSEVYFSSDNLFDTADVDGKLSLDTISKITYKVE